jgi:NosR/NirI family nitrous oxide reductase transcriptional regulator
VKRLLFIVMMVSLCWTGMSAQAASRFPQPQFESGYEIPSPTTPDPRQDVYEYVDVVLLFIALSAAALIALKRRRRKEMFVLMVACLAYFGFWREGCICPVGSLQNVVMAIAYADYAIPLTVLAFFLLPLAFTLLFGRVFCAAVCPLGGVQDMVAVHPLRLPRWLSQTLGLIPYAYLALAVLFVATGSGFIVCRYDPFVALFRFTGSASLLLYGAVLLLIGTVVARPYCRFICPYGVLLNWMSRFSWRHMPITPTECVQCKLCEESCPFDAINKPSGASKQGREREVHRLAVLLCLLPVLAFAGGWTASHLDVSLSMSHRSVALAEQIAAEAADSSVEATEESDAFRASGDSVASLYADAWRVRKQFAVGLWIVGGFMGLVIGGKLIVVSIRRTRVDYEPDRPTCLSCARCFASCPKDEKQKRPLK